MIDFLLEIGVEEFPPKELIPAAKDLSGRVEKLLKDKKIFYRTARTIYTSRRIGVLILGVASKQKAQVIEIPGPPKKFAYGTDGKPSTELLGFMKANQLRQSEVSLKKTKKGEYVYGQKEIKGEITEDILYDEVPKIIDSLQFSKTMRWDGHQKRFPRPIRWIVCLLDRRPLRFEYAGIKANRYSSPNYHFSFNPIRLEKPREYINLLRHGGVVVDPYERRKIIRQKIKQAAARLHKEPVYTEEMIEEISCTLEYPDAVVGEFSEEYLKLPEEVLQSALRSQGNLVWIRDTNKFICVFSARKKASPNVQKGYSAVMAARLYDAMFYYKNDLTDGIEKMLERTKGMVWLKDLGNLFDKAKRLSTFVKRFDALDGLDTPALQRAAILCKADLLSQMVREKEFTSLQGIMGGYYATSSGEDEVVVQAIREQYLPRFVGDRLPETKEGSILSISDKLDNIIGGFLSEKRPSGSYDPLGMRRQGYAIMNLLDANSFHVSLSDMSDELLGQYKKRLDNKDILYEFFRERLTRYLLDKGYRYDEINACLAVSFFDPVDARQRCEALKNFRKNPEFVDLVIGQKRVRNILKGITNIPNINETLLKEAAEKNLFKAGKENEVKLNRSIDKRNYPKTLKLLLSMRRDIDKFFDDVLVMCEPEDLRNNRLALVIFINQLFLKFADLSQIVIKGKANAEK